MTAFEVAMKSLGISEGGFSNDPQDKGGATMEGITQNSYNTYRQTKGLDAKPVNDASHDEVLEMYHQYWDRTAAHIEIKHPALAVEVFDQAFNSHDSMAVKLLQLACKASIDKVDGTMGAETVALIDSCGLSEAELIERYALLRLGWYVGREQKHFEAGWLKRVLRMFAAAKTLVS